MRQELFKKRVTVLLVNEDKLRVLMPAHGAQKPGLRELKGGYRLLKAPQEYTVYQILCVTEGSLAPVACLEHAPNACPRSGQCPTLPLWQGLEDVVRGYLSGVTLRELMLKDAKAQSTDC